MSEFWNLLNKYWCVCWKEFTIPILDKKWTEDLENEWNSEELERKRKREIRESRLLGIASDSSLIPSLKPFLPFIPEP